MKFEKFMKFLEENGISRRYARNSFAVFVIATIAPFLYNSFVIVPRHKRYREALEDRFFDLPKKEFNSYWKMSDEEREKFMDKLAEEVKIEVFGRSK